MRLLTKAEACRELRLSLSTLNRRIAAGEVPVRREPRGRRHRVYVMLDDGLPGNGEADDSALAVAQERVSGLEEQVAILQGQLDQERQRSTELAKQLTAAQTNTAPERRGPWWRFWQSREWENRRVPQQDGYVPSFSPAKIDAPHGARHNSPNSFEYRQDSRHYRYGSTP